MTKKALLIILDGWGLYQEYLGNAINQAQTPFFDGLWQNYPAATLQASGLSVGLPEGQMGTSEVNHFTIGASQVVFQDLVRINQSIEDNTLNDNPVLNKAINHALKHNSTLHLLGLVSPGGVHSHQDHIASLASIAKQKGIKNLLIHAITDGRDTPPTHGLEYLQHLQDQLENLEIGQIASIIGRYFAMDRDTNWDRTQKALDLYLQGKGQSHSSFSAAMHQSYTNKTTDEFAEPVIINSAFQALKANDALIFINFRNDRTRQLTQKILDAQVSNLHFTTMTQYHPDYPIQPIFKPHTVDQSLGSVLSHAGITQYRITETEKFAHVTFFLNCKREEPFKGEDRFMFPSNSDIPTHDLKPEMRVHDIAANIIDTIKKDQHQVIITNLCNPDMVGHTGNIPAAIKACQAVDQSLSRIIPVAKKSGFDIIITADHGNAEQMLDQETGEMLTSHTLNPVPFILISNNHQTITRHHGNLTDIAPTILDLLGIPTPPSMTGQSFIPKIIA